MGSSSRHPLQTEEQVPEPGAADVRQVSDAVGRHEEGEEHVDPDQDRDQGTSPDEHGDRKHHQLGVGPEHREREGHAEDRPGRPDEGTYRHEGRKPQGETAAPVPQNR